MRNVIFRWGSQNSAHSLDKYTFLKSTQTVLISFLQISRAQMFQHFSLYFLSISIFCSLFLFVSYQCSIKSFIACLARFISVFQSFEQKRKFRFFFLFVCVQKSRYSSTNGMPINTKIPNKIESISKRTEN